MRTHKAFINNEFIDNNEWLEIINPSSLKPAGRVTALKKEDINKAYLSARKAQKKWENLKLITRIEYVNKFKLELLKQKDIIAKIMSEEIAKSIKESKTEIERTAEIIDYTIEEVKRLNPLAMTGEGMGVENKIGVFSRVAKGVVCAIAPFNYPINLSIAKIIPALLTGNTVVFKPATAGSLCGAFLANLAIAAGFPEGIFNIVTGRGRDIGDFITAHPEINMISFTGSVGIGNHLKKTASTSDLVLELGGKDPALILDEYDLEKYATEIVSGAFGYSGQRCTAIKRVLVSDVIADKLVPILKQKVEQLSVGFPENNPDITPLVDINSINFIQELIDEAKFKKATIICGDKTQNNLMWPTLVDNVTVEMKLAWEEPFGPVLPIIRVNSVDEMINIANQSNFGLQASVFCQNISQALTVANQLETGTVNLNSRPQRGPDCFPFLGIKDSGVGVQGIRESLLSMTRYKGIVINY